MILGGDLPTLLIAIAIALFTLWLMRDMELWFKIMFVIGMMYTIGVSLLYIGINLPEPQATIICFEYIGIPIALMFHFDLIEKYLGRYAQFVSMAIGGVGGMLLGSGLKKAVEVLPQITGGLINIEMAKIIASSLAFIHLALIGLGIFLGYIFYKEYHSPFESFGGEELGELGGEFKLPKLPSFGEEKHFKLKF